jgi:hypothetical protein
MLLNGVDGVSEHLRNIVGRSATAEHIDRERIPEAMWMGVRNACALPERTESLI